MAFGARMRSRTLFVSTSRGKGLGFKILTRHCADVRFEALPTPTDAELDAVLRKVVRNAFPDPSRKCEHFLQIEIWV